MYKLVHNGLPIKLTYRTYKLLYLLNAITISVFVFNQTGRYIDFNYALIIKATTGYKVRNGVNIK